MEVAQESDLIRNFFVQIRNSLISQDKYDNLNALIAIIQALDNMGPVDRQYFFKQLIDFDFFFHYKRFITSNEDHMKLTMKITLALLEDEKIFYHNFTDMLKMHLRAFFFLAKDVERTKVEMVIDCVTFIQIMQERLNGKLRSKKKSPLMNVPSEFYDAFRLTLTQCNNETVKKLYFIHLCQILSTIIGKESPVKHSLYLCRALANICCMTIDSLLTTTIFLNKFIIKDKTILKSDDFLEWLQYVFNGVIQRNFLDVPLHSIEFLEIRIFFIYTLKVILESDFMDQNWIFKHIIKFFLHHNGLRYLIMTIKDSIHTRNHLGIVLSKSVLAHISTMIEIIYSYDNEMLIWDDFSLKKMKNFNTLFQFSDLSMFDLIDYDLISGFGCQFIVFDEWKLFMIFLWIGIKCIGTVSKAKAFINVVSFLEIAFVQEFQVPEFIIKLSMEAYCKTWLMVPEELKNELGISISRVDSFFIEYFTKNYPSQAKLWHNPDIQMYFCIKIKSKVQTWIEMVEILLQNPELAFMKNVIDVFNDKESFLLDRLNSENVTHVMKFNIVSILLKLELENATVNKMLDEISRDQNTRKTLMYLPIITKNLHQFNRDRRELLTYCVLNQIKGVELEDEDRVTLMDFFTKSIIEFEERE
uniref:CSON001434 protein n=1 Tax=Culicoides sonorensis TaxID=179676 RepID=A0A336ML16_CULSO